MTFDALPQYSMQVIHSSMGTKIEHAECLLFPCVHTNYGKGHQSSCLYQNGHDFRLSMTI